MKVDPPARIPANTVEGRAKLARPSVYPSLPGRAVRVFGWSLNMSCSDLRLRPYAACFFLIFSIQTAAQSPPESPSLAPVVVSATRFETSSATLAQAVSVITAQELVNSGVTTVNEALMKILGLPGRLDFYGGGEYSIDLRGFTTVGGTNADPNQVVVVDGVRLKEGDLSSVRISSIPIDSVERIEVLRGSSAVMYGEGATGGVVVITTKTGAGLDTRSGAALSTGVGSNNTVHKQGQARLVAGDFSLLLAGQRNQSNNHRDNFNAQVEADQLTGQWRFQNSRVVAGYIRDELLTGLPGSLTRAQYEANPRQTTKPHDSAKISSERLNLMLETALNDWNVALDLGKRYKSLFSPQPSSSYTTKYGVETSNLGLRARLERPLAGLPNALVAGIEQIYWNRVDVLGDPGTKNQTNLALYAKNEVVLPGRTRLSAGLRSERIEKTSAKANTRQNENAWDIGVFHPLHAGLGVYGRIGQSFRQPNLDELGYKPDGVTLQTQTSKDYEVGLRQTSGSWLLEARYYLSQLNNELGYANYPIRTSSNAYNINLDPTQRQGLEAETRWELSAALSLRANAALRQAVFTSGSYSGYYVPLAPPYSMSLRANWRQSAHTRWDGGVIWVGPQYVDTINSCTMPGYAVSDIRYSRDLSRVVQVSLSLNNLMDHKYFTYAAKCSAGLATDIYPEAGRMVMATAKLTF
jgi:iron complex outermembrane receptor protein